MRSRSAGLARPVRTEPNSLRVASTDFCMRSPASAISSLVISLISSAAYPAPLIGIPFDVLGFPVLAEERDRIWLACGERARLGPDYFADREVDGLS